MSGLPCSFLFLFNVILRILNILYSNCVVIICFSNLIIVRDYLSYFIVLCLSFGGLKADERFLPARPTIRPPLPSWCRHDRPKLAPRMVQPRLSSPRHVLRNLAHQGPVPMVYEISDCSNQGLGLDQGVSARPFGLGQGHPVAIIVGLGQGTLASPV